MKKLFFILMATICFASTNAIAQEVRGVETKKVDSPGNSDQYSFAFTNMNSITVCVDAVLYYKRESATERKEEIEDKKSFTLKPGETYLWKNIWKHSNVASRYYVDYKAYKLQ